MEASRLLIVAIPVILVLAVVLVVATAASRPPKATASLGREARRADRAAWGDYAVPRDPDDEARKRFEVAKPGTGAAKEPAPSAVRSAAGGLVEVGPRPDPEVVGVTRRRFLNRGILAFQSLVLSSFALAVIGFLWPGRAGGFGGKVAAGKVSRILDAIRDTREPFYVPEARAYINPYPDAALAEAEEVYPESILAGMKEAGVVALSQKCPHLGCRVPWCPSSQWFECPCHGSKYNRVGEKKGGPAPRGMDRFPVDVSGGAVVINTGIVIQGPPIGTDTTGQEAEGPNCV